MSVYVHGEIGRRIHVNSIFLLPVGENRLSQSNRHVFIDPTQGRIVPNISHYPCLRIPSLIITELHLKKRFVPINDLGLGA